MSILGTMLKAGEIRRARYGPPRRSPRIDVIEREPLEVFIEWHMAEELLGFTTDQVCLKCTRQGDRCTPEECANGLFINFNKYEDKLA